MVAIKSVDSALRQAKVLARTGKLVEAQQLYDAILLRFPNNRRATTGLKAVIKKRPAGVRLSQQDVEAMALAYSSGQYDQALAMVNMLLAQHPEFSVLHNQKGACLLALGKPEEAERAFSSAIALEPTGAKAHNNLGNALKAQGRYQQATESFNEAIRLDPKFAAAWNNLGNAENENGQSEEALRCFEEALSIQPDLLEAHSNLANVQQSIGRISNAVDHYEQALQIDPNQAVVHRNLATIKHYDEKDAQLERMETLLHSNQTSETDRAHLNFALGKAYEDLGFLDKAFRHVDEGNRLWRKNTDYSLESDQVLFSRIRDIYEVLRDMPIFRTDSKRSVAPIFVVGLPRSGTSLVEQILASHPEVHGAGELGAMEQAVSPVVRGEIGGVEAIRHIRQTYLEAISGLGHGGTAIVDKMPLNFRWIGLIALAIPEAKFVNCNRCSMATGWSIFKHLFPARQLGFAYSLEDIARYTELTSELMAYWQIQLPDLIYDLNYEKLTEDQEIETARLLENCGLDFDQRCIHFHLTDRAVRTASAKQVRLPLYQGSSLAWKAYEDYLGQLSPKTHPQEMSLAS